MLVWNLLIQKIYQSLIYILVVVILIGCTRKKDVLANEPHAKKTDIEDSFDWTPSYDAKTKLFKIVVDVDEGFHAYGKKETVGRPVNFILDLKNGWKKTAPKIIPDGDEKSLEGVGDVFVLENNFELTQTLIQGRGPIDGTFYIQICTETQCDRPRSFKFKLDVINE